MAETPTGIDIKKIMSYSDDLVGVLRNKKDVNGLMQSLEEAKMLQSTCGEDFFQVQNSIEEYKKKLDACKQRIDEAKHEVISDREINRLQNELENELQKERLLKDELSTVDAEINDLEQQKIIVEERKKHLTLSEQEELQARFVLEDVAGEPTGTDGSDYSYRMIVDPSTRRSRAILLHLYMVVSLIVTLLPVTSTVTNDILVKVIQEKITWESRIVQFERARLKLCNVMGSFIFPLGYVAGLYTLQLMSQASSLLHLGCILSPGNNPQSSLEDNCSN